MMATRNEIDARLKSIGEEDRDIDEALDFAVGEWIDTQAQRDLLLAACEAVVSARFAWEDEIWPALEQCQAAIAAVKGDE